RPASGALLHPACFRNGGRFHEGRVRRGVGRAVGFPSGTPGLPPVGSGAPFGRPRSGSFFRPLPPISPRPGAGADRSQQMARRLLALPSEPQGTRHEGDSMRMGLWAVVVGMLGLAPDVHAGSAVLLGPTCADLPRATLNLVVRQTHADYRHVLAAVRASRTPEEQVEALTELIVREADRNGLDPRLVTAVIFAESTFNPRATSPVGARGLMQLMPGTGRWLLERRGERLTRTADLYEPELNVALGTSYLAELIERFGWAEHALVAYNAGPAAARRILAEPARRNRFIAGYPRKVMREWARLKTVEPAPLAVERTGDLALTR